MCYLAVVWSWMPIIFWYLQGALTLVIAGVTVHIAREQWKTNERRLRLETYDRKLKVWQAVRDFIDAVNRDGYLAAEALTRLSEEAAEADFLFGEEIPNYIEEVYKHGLRIHLEKRDESSEEAEIDWFLRQPEIAVEKFKKYLKLG